MKKTALIIIMLNTCLQVWAQRDEERAKPELPPNRFFIGSGFGLGFYSGGYNIGLNPELGYSPAQWVDIGLGINLNYYNLSADYNYGIRQTSFNYGGGPFLRIYPLPFLFAQGQYEYNKVDYTLTDMVNGGIKTKYSVSSSSILAGVGYAQRVIGRANFYTVLLFDLGGDHNSPYTDSYGSAYPFIRAGFNFYLGSSHR